MNSGRICVSVCAVTADEIPNKIKAAEQYADIIEVRFDCLPSGELLQALRYTRSGVPVIATYRSPEQGGKTNASLVERQAFWSAIPGETWAVDLEEDVFPSVSTHAERILSFHDHDTVPTDLERIIARMLASDADLIKVAVKANDVVDAIPLWKHLSEDRRVVPIAMGEAGKWTRILSLAHGAFLTYASPDAGSATADGQLTAGDLTHVYRAKQLDAATRVYGVIGYPVSRSVSPYLHNAAFSAANINSVFIPLEVRDLDAFIERMVRPDTREVDLNFAGFAVTMPHKQAIIRYLDEIDPVAEIIGAVNTVKIDGSKLTGYNTDADGFLKPLREVVSDLRDMKVAVAGTGGASRACAYSLKKAGASVTILGRDTARTDAAAGLVGVSSADILTAALSGFDGLVNATPVGMKGVSEGETLFRADQLRNLTFVYDLVTSSSETPLLAEARKAGTRAIGGLEMLVAQAELQFGIWTGQAPTEGVMMGSLSSRSAN